MHRLRFILAAVAVALLAPAAALAAGGHDSIGCVGCHSLHTAKGDMIFAVAPNTKYLNPKTKQPYTGTTALCLGCHQDSDKGGQGYAPISQHVSHPFGLTSINPKIANVPQDYLREGGRFECMGCHDPHPANANYKYLRMDVGGKGESMDRFCAACHSSKADASARGAAPAKATVPASAPAKKK